jgi:outer membrane lipoprotein-sorting protein
LRIADLGLRRRSGAPLVLLTVLMMAGPLGAGSLTAKQILERAGRHYDAVRDYTVDAKLTVDSPSMHVPEMKIKVFYKKPDKVHVESRDGFAMLPKQGALVGNPLRDMAAGSDLSVARSERVSGDDCYVIKGTFEHEERSAQATVWIDMRYFLVRRMSVNPEWGPSVSARLWYVKVGNKYWLPRTTEATVSLPPMPDENPEAERKPRGPTIVKLTFANYRVNTGLNDKIFHKQEGSK